MLTSNYKNIINGTANSTGSSLSIDCSIKNTDGNSFTGVYSGSMTGSNNFGKFFAEQILLKNSDELMASTSMSPDKAYSAQAVMFDSDISDTDYALKTAVGTTSISNIGGKIGITVANSSGSDITINGILLCMTILVKPAYSYKTILVAEWKFDDLVIPNGDSKTWTVDHNFELG